MEERDLSVVSVRFNDELQAVVREAIDPDGVYKYRTPSEFIQNLVERWGHSRKDRVTREQRDAMVERIYDNTEKLVAWFIESDDVDEDVSDFGPAQNTLRAVRDAFRRTGLTAEDFSEADDEAGRSGGMRSDL